MIPAYKHITSAYIMATLLQVAGFVLELNPQEILSNVVDEIFSGSIIGAASRAVLIFSSAQPPKPDSATLWHVTASLIWLRLGGV